MMTLNLENLPVDELASVNNTLEALPQLPQKIAKTISPLIETLDIETYKHFLITMYHYTRDAEKQLKFARDLCEGTELKEYFEEMAREERGHYLLAKRDFEEFGGNVEEHEEPSYVRDFREYWYDLGKENVNEFVGAMYVFENVATAVASVVVDMMKRLELTKRQSRWLLVHLEADVGHGDEAWEMVRKTVRDNPEAMLRAAEQGEKEWTKVFEHAFTKQNWLKQYN